MKFINREISWLAFNRRVLEEAQDVAVPLLERLRFLAISATNLDEFFMVRVGGLHLMVREDPRQTDKAGFTPAEQLEMISRQIHTMYQDMYACLNDGLLFSLEDIGIHLTGAEALSPAQRTFAENLFFTELAPVLTPMALREEEKFPLLANLGLHVLLRLKTEDGAVRFVVIPLGRSLQRVYFLAHTPGTGYILLETVVKLFATHLFPRETVLEAGTFRITRNADLELQEEFTADIKAEMKKILSEREKSPCVRLEVESALTDTSLSFLRQRLAVTSRDIYRHPGPLDLSCLYALSETEGYEKHQYDPLPPLLPPTVDLTRSIFEIIAQNDVLLFHPYESFEPVVRLIQEAAEDPRVLSIKQTLYRVSDNSPIVNALRTAVRKGKDVSVVVELKARFSEARNIEWAKKLEEEGAQVIYGVKHYKTHAKICIVVRREPGGIVRYLHFGTGNYNEVTARLFSDVSFMTCHPIYGKDASGFFNAVTGFSQVIDYEKLIVAPTGMRKRFYELIRAETERARQGQKAEIIAKVNSLGDPGIIEALYRASQAGVHIQLNVRGICCLQPGVKGLSETITVISILDRYLEHSRIFYFYHGGEELLFISSADWLSRNLDQRIELMVPLESPPVREKLVRILRTCFQDTVKARRMNASGEYVRLKNGKGRPLQSQLELYRMLRREAEIAEQQRQTTFEPYQSAES